MALRAVRSVRAAACSLRAASAPAAPCLPQPWGLRAGPVRTLRTGSALLSGKRGRARGVNPAASGEGAGRLRPRVSAHLESPVLTSGSREATPAHASSYCWDPWLRGRCCLPKCRGRHHSLCPAGWGAGRRNLAHTRGRSLLDTGQASLSSIATLGYLALVCIVGRESGDTVGFALLCALSLRSQVRLKQEHLMKLKHGS